MLRLPSMSEIWRDGYKTNRESKKPRKDSVDKSLSFAVEAPDGEILGYASTTTAVAQLVVAHKKAKKFYSNE